MRWGWNNAILVETDQKRVGYHEEMRWDVERLN